jgi:hypothetical protein
VGKGDRVMVIAGIVITVFLLVLHVVYQGRNIIKANFRNHILILLFASLGSALMADMYHDQSFSITLYQQHALYFYFFYFLLHYLLPEPKRLEKMLIIYGIIYCSFYIVQRMVYPRLITEALIFWDRGTLRIFMPGEIIMILGYFICFDKIFAKFNWLYLVHLVLSLIVALLLGTRMILFSLIVLSLANILINKRVKNKLAIFGLFIGVAFISYFAMKDTFNDMISATKHHADQSSDYIRVRAAVYFVTKLPENRTMFVLGNGTPSERSPYGIMLAHVSNMFGFYLSDIGMVAIYVKFGLFFMMTCFVIMFQCIFSKLNGEIMYIKYFMAYLLLTMVTTQLPFEFSEGIVVLGILLYMIDYYKATPTRKPIF